MIAEPEWHRVQVIPSARVWEFIRKGKCGSLIFGEISQLPLMRSQVNWRRQHHLAMALGDTVMVTPTGSEPLNQMGTGLTVN